MAQIATGAFPSIPAGNGSCNTLFDPSYAPEGQHVAFWWPFAPFAVDGHETNWERRREEYGFSYVVFSGGSFERMAPLVSRLAGT